MSWYIQWYPAIYHPFNTKRIPVPTKITKTNSISEIVLVRGCTRPEEVERREDLVGLGGLDVEDVVDAVLDASVVDILWITL